MLQVQHKAAYFTGFGFARLHRIRKNLVYRFSEDGLLLSGLCCGQGFASSLPFSPFLICVDYNQRAIARLGMRVAISATSPNGRNTKLQGSRLGQVFPAAVGGHTP